MRTRSTAGFTVIEMAVVVAVIGIATAVILPRVSRGIQSSNAQGAASIVAADMETAWSTAARARKPVVVSCTCGSFKYQVADQNGDTVRVARTMDAASGVQVNAMTFSPATVVIGPNGLATAAQTITLTVGSSTRTVTVSRTGFVRIQTQ